MLQGMQVKKQLLGSEEQAVRKLPDNYMLQLHSCKLLMRCGRTMSDGSKLFLYTY
jgi:hypothetical protein